jgi:hypothetical protein
MRPPADSRVDLRARAKKSYYWSKKQSKMRPQTGLPGLTKHKKIAGVSDNHEQH